ncbi:MAG: UDP-3-O-(3-hydroxymyristoyl)glucosamine N-acyltransferase [Bacteroidota bacterium]
MQISAKELGVLLKGHLEGDPDVMVSAPSKIEEGRPGTITFLANPKYEPHAYTTKASILLVSRDFQPVQPIAATLIRVDDVYASLAFLLEQFGQQAEQQRVIAERASVHESAEIGEGVAIGEFTVVEAGSRIGANCTLYPQVFVGKNVVLGNNVTLYPGVKIYHDCQIGDNCVLHANVVIGCDGFGYVPQEDRSYRKIAQIGNVVIESDVEIGSNTVIDRATMGSTFIRRGVKLDNLIQIAHNVDIGEHTAIAAQAGVAGSTQIGQHCMIGGQAGFVGHIKVADGAKVQAQSGVAAPIKTENTAVYGSPAIDYSNYLRSYAVFKQLPALYKRISELERKLREG